MQDGRFFTTTARFLFLVLAVIMPVSPAIGDSLQEVMESNSYKGVTLKNQRYGEDYKRWFKPDTNMWSVFAQGKQGISNLGKWIAGDTKEYVPRGEQALRGREYRGLVIKYAEALTPTPTFLVTILVLHPKYEEFHKFGLLEQFSKMEPPKLSVKHTEQITVQGFPARLFQHRGTKACSVVVELARNTRVQVLMEECANKTDRALDLADKLDLKRLNRKLGA